MFEKKRYKVRREKENSFAKRVANARNSITAKLKKTKKPSLKILIPVAIVLIILVVLICVGLSSFVVKGCVADDAYAVEKGSLKKVLNSATVSDNVDLLGVELGEVIYTTAGDPDDYYIGEDKKNVDSGYPMFTRSGSVLYFVDDSFNLITENWGWITSYSALYLSDGMTFNADNERADTEDIILVEVDGGFQLAQEATVTVAGKEYTIPMNSICALELDSITYYSYVNDSLVGNVIEMSDTSTFEIGGEQYNYTDFLIELGLWEADIVVTTPETEDDTSATEPKTTREKQTKEGSGAETTSAKSETTKEDVSTTVPEPETWTREPITTEPETSTAEPKPPAYKEPKVEFGEAIDEWIYTLTITATVEDESASIEDGIQLYIYEVDDQGNDSKNAVMRKAFNGSGTIILSPLEPGKNYHIIAKYTYTTKLGYPQDMTVDVGRASTLPFSEAKTIKLSLRDESENSTQVKEETKVEIFSNKIQIRDIVFDDISKGISVEVGSAVKVSDLDPYTEETYVNSFIINAENKTKEETREVKLGSNAIKLLSGGYTISHIETADVFTENCKYEYQIQLKDRFGNVFTIEPDSTHPAHTSATTPYVQITVPNETNAFGATRINITFNNPDEATLSEGELYDGSKIVTAMYIVKYGDELIPENAINLKAYLSDDTSKTMVEGKYLNIHHDGKTDTTSWTITNLDSSLTYQAVVICGSYDINDEKVHNNENLKTPQTFISGNIASLGTIPFTNVIEDITYESAMVNLKVMYNKNQTYFKNELMPLTSKLVLTLTEDETERVQTLEFKADELRDISMPTDVTTEEDPETHVITYSATVNVPAYLDGSSTSLMVPVRLKWVTLPIIEEKTPTNVWDFLLYSSATANSEQCYFGIDLGMELPENEETPNLMTLYSGTKYTGTVQIFASLGGDTEYDVTSKSTKIISFTTLNKNACIIIENAFVSSSFAEIYGVCFEDEDECIIEDKADREGNNLLLQVFDEDNYVVYSEYICSDSYYDTIRIDGLEYEKTYTMTIKALQYKNFNEKGQELIYTDYDLNYKEPQNEDKPKVYTFTTGESVNGEITLESVSSFYESGDTSVSILKDEDYYQYMHSYYAYAYTSEENLSQYLTDFEEKETDLQKYNSAVYEKYINEETKDNYLVHNTSSSIQYSSGAVYKASASTARYNPNSHDSTKWILSSWTSKFVKVNPGEYYSFYNISDTSSYDITFYYVSDDNELRYATWYWNYEMYYRGAAFKVPETKFVYNGKQYQIAYMRISGYTTRTNRGAILQLYKEYKDEDPTASKENLFNDETEIVMNQYIYYWGGTITKSVAQTSNYTKTYIPVTGGSIYEIKGLDQQNTDDELAATGGTNSRITIGFYNSAHRFIATYYVSGQTGLVKAPEGACYLRVNITRDVNDNIDRTKISIKEFEGVNENDYIATVGIKLSDYSDYTDPDKQILQGGYYYLYMYNVNHSVKNGDDLSALPESDWDYMSKNEFKVEKVEGTYLNIDELYDYTRIPQNAGYKVILTIKPEGWTREITIGTVYFNTIRTVKTISTREEFLAIRNDPAGNYIVTADLDITDWNTYLTDSDRPFTGSIDFQGHSLIWRSFYHIFYTLGAGASFRNGEISIIPTAETGVSAHYYYTSLFRTNYGSIENIVLHYGPERNGAINEFCDVGAICYTNYGTIDGFVVGITKDISAQYSFGLICRSNYGDISNGYVYGETITDKKGNTRYARLVHNYGTSSSDDITATYGTDAQYISCGVSYNTTRGTMSNIYILTDVMICSESGLADSAGSYDGGKTKDTSVSNMNYASVLCSLNYGQIDDCFTYGDRYDYGYTMNYTDGKWTYGGDGYQTVITKLGPAITISGQLNHAENVTYFSPTNSRYTNTSSTVLQNSNLYGVEESLWDYQWYEERLGMDGDRFNIRSCIESESGYFPQLILPNTFSADAQTPILLPGAGSSTIELSSSEVRQQGTTSAVITLTFRYRNKKVPIKAVEIVDRTGNALTTEVIAQRAVNNEYRVDVLVSMNENTGAYSSYTLNSVTAGTKQYSVRDGLSTDSGEAKIGIKFYKKIATVSDWKTYIVGGPLLNYENYLITGNLDFSASQKYTDWYTGNNQICGVIDGGIYEEIVTPILSEAGEVILDENDEPRTIAVMGSLAGMHKISGVGSFNQNNNLAEDRVASDNSIIKYLYGTLTNIVFENIWYNNVKTVGSTTYGDSTSAKYINRSYAGVVANTYSGSTIDNVHLRDSYIRGVYYVGGLVAYARGGTIINSSVKNTAVQTYRAPNTYPTSYTGGIGGILSGVLVKNCFAADTSVLVYDAFATTGTGGIAGYLTNSVADTCYTTGEVYSVYDYVGGIAGYMNGGGSAITNCWSNMNVTTLYDFAGSIVGYHGDGAVTGNFGAGNVISKASGSNYVHRICSNTDINSTTRYDNFAYAEQYITYVDEDGRYHYGTWTEDDGASELISYADTKNVGTWTEKMSIYDGYDIEGTATAINTVPEGGQSISGGTQVTEVGKGILPKLVNDTTGILLYDQPDISLVSVTDTFMYVKDITIYEASEKIHIGMVIYNSRDMTIEEVSQLTLDDIADWDNINITGATIDKNSLEATGTYCDTSIWPSHGRYVEFDMYYGDAGGDEGHYLDYYLMSVPTYLWTKDEQGQWSKSDIPERNSQSITPASITYRNIGSITEWNNFFSDSKYKNSLENVRITGDIFISSNDANLQKNVILNRLVSEKDSGDHYKFYMAQNDSGLVISNGGLINRIASKLAKVDFENIKITSNSDNTRKGIIAHVGGTVENVNITNCNYTCTTQSRYVGFFGQSNANMSNIIVNNMNVSVAGNTNSYYIGALVGYMNIGDISNVQVYNSTVNAPNASSVGGAIGYFNGNVGYTKNNDVYVDVPGIYVNGVTVKGYSYIGGAFGQIGSNSAYIRNVYVGYTAGDDAGTIGTETTGRTDSTNPGALLDNGNISPSVTVTNEGTTVSTTTNYTSFGGLVGYANYYVGDIENCHVYNTLVAAKYGTTSYVGGIAGQQAPSIYNCDVENCTIYGTNCNIGGIEGYRLEGGGNTSKENVIYSTRTDISGTSNVGGICGYTYERQTRQNLSQHCIIYGISCVGGDFGYTYYPYYENGALDNLVFGVNNVGGMAGYCTYYYWYGSNYVTASESPVSTTITPAMLPGLSSDALKILIPNLSYETYSGALVQGTTNVGGLIGTNTGFPYNCYVSAGVTVKGVDNVGGLVGNFYGWSNTYYLTTPRRMYNCSSGAEVIGTNYVGGLIGYYNRSDKTSTETKEDPPTSTANYPNKSYFYGLLFTGTVEGTTHTDFLIGGFADVWNQGLTADNTGNTMFGTSRIYENSSINVNGAITYAYQISGIKSYESVAARSSDFGKILTASADSLTKSEFYYSADNNYGGGGLGWSSTYWDEDACVRLYTAPADKASSASVEPGLAKSTDHMVVWLDGKNNTGNGYTDTEAGTWKNSGTGGSTYDATLTWKGETAGNLSNLTNAQVNSYMVWGNGGLKFIQRDPAVNDKYRATLNNSISDILNTGNFTVEITFTYTKDIFIPSFQAANSILWRTLLNYRYLDSTDESKDNCGSFMTRMGVDTGKTYTNYMYLGNDYKSNYFNGDAYNTNGLNNRTVTFVCSNGNLTAYSNGKKLNTKTIGTNYFPSGAEWFIGSNQFRYYNGSYTTNSSTYYNGYMNFSSLRVYDTALTDAEVQNNYEYDQWYYYEGTKPASATAVSGEASMWTDGNTYKLCRSDDGSYGGVVIDESWTNGGSLGTLGQGYYYLTDGAGRYSDIVAKYSPTYGMRLVSYYDRTLSDAAKYKETGVVILRGQEGEDASGNLYDTDDQKFEGGNRLPNITAGTKRGNREAVAKLSSMSVMAMNMDLPGVNAYASGIDTINLELDGDAPSGLHYCIWSGDEKVLDTEWPQGSRTVTVNYDFNSDFVVEVYTAEDVAEQYYFTASEVKKSVMTYGDSYWYLYAGNCLDSTNTSIGAAVHLYDGLMLAADGTITNVENGAVTGTAGAAYTVVDTKPLWSGTIALSEGISYVESYGSYLMSEGGIKDVQLVVRKNVAYTLPATSVPGSFIVDTYNESVFTTVLDGSGALSDQGNAIVYPEDFGNANIRETSNNLNYSGQMILVRYNSGKLVAFNYMTGETAEVLSDESEAESLWDFVKESLGIGSKNTGTKTGSNPGTALDAKNYEKELADNPSTNTARERLKTLETASDEILSEGGAADIITDASGTAQKGSESEASSDDPSGIELPDGMGGGTGEGGGNAVNNGQMSDEEIAEVLSVDTRFVTYYGKEESDKVYDLEELLTVSDDKLVSENERAEVLAQEGFATSLSNTKIVVAATETSGLLIVILICCGIIVLAGCMIVIIRKYRLSK